MFFIYFLALEPTSDKNKSGDTTREQHYIILLLCYSWSSTDTST